MESIPLSSIRTSTSWSWISAFMQYATHFLWPWIYTLCAGVNILCIQLEHLEEWVFINKFKQGTQMGKRCEPGLFSNYKWETWLWEGNWHKSALDICSWWKRLDNSKVFLFLFFSFRHLILCPENEINDSYDSCHCSQLGMFLGKKENCLWGKSG